MLPPDNINRHQTTPKLQEQINQKQSVNVAGAQKKKPNAHKQVYCGILLLCLIPLLRFGSGHPHPIPTYQPYLPICTLYITAITAIKENTHTNTQTLKEKNKIISRTIKQTTNQLSPGFYFLLEISRPNKVFPLKKQFPPSGSINNNTWFYKVFSLYRGST